MALISCSEGSNQISDAAISCPTCGHPQQPLASAPVAKPKQEKKELFKAGGSNFVLAEIAAMSSTKTRNWVWVVIGLPVAFAIIFGWLSFDWPIAVGITVAGLFILGFIYNDKGLIASTGNITEIEEDMEKVSQRYHDSIKQDDLVVYQGKNMFIDMNFTINPERIAEFSKSSSNGHYWLYVLGASGFATGFMLQEPFLYIITTALIILGIMSRKAALEVTGVGGAKMELYTRSGDIQTVIQDLTQSIEANSNA
ncbi:zinc ribbon domain-containing protein [Amphritea balenae]|uniref:Zinc ribbon domain-containing protein n=1 Tax=Amphritea balenae TaxID=452629 RepID=A0A3P1STG0_9GAMM|nr:zinc ribbon domain-containing protein [Amphritea balenae]RRD00441.1 zinc ribbon domain-containing protein [Amphritea balenae]GGK70825.1 hypothetical protein GCM10007941_21210 [Amphritea balenae]